MLRRSGLIVCGMLLGLSLFAWRLRVDRPSYIDGGQPSQRLFESIPKDRTGVDFVNALSPRMDTRHNLFDFDYYYNGGGVALADFNNDGLVDIFFCGNEVSDRLYYNRGNWQFEDVSEASGILKGEGWSNGVTVVDINGDGWMDIYVCRGGPDTGTVRKNALYINHNGKYFEERAEEYGLDDNGLSTQAVFFDYDRDGDQDCFVLNENDYYGLPPIDFFNTVGLDSQRFHTASSHLYENIGGMYRDVTARAGLLKPTFGLGVLVVDINRDGWWDLYVANDYFIPDMVWINQRDGTFRDEARERIKQMVFYGMGLDAGDLDNDSDEDIYVLDMAYGDHYRSKKLMRSMNVDNFRLLVRGLRFPYQYMYNALLMNNGSGYFDNVAHYAGVAKTGWSWAALIEDIDGDGLKDILVTTGYRRYALDNDFQLKVLAAKRQYGGKVPLHVKEDLYNSMWSETYPNIAYRNMGNMTFADVSDEWGFALSGFSNGAALGDLDNDGDLDIVVNNIDHDAYLLKNNHREKRASRFLTVVLSGKLRNHRPTVTVYTGQQRLHKQIRRVRGYFSCSQPVAYFGLGNIDRVDSLVLEWEDGTTCVWVDPPIDTVYRVDEKCTDRKQLVRADVDTVSVFKQIPAERIGLTYRHVEDPYDDFQREILLPYKQSTIGPPIAVGDVNGDGWEDVLIGGAHGQALQLYLNEGNRFRLQDVEAFQLDAAYEDGGLCLVDLDRDGDLDLYVVSAGNSLPQGHPMYHDRCYLNDGHGGFTRWHAVRAPRGVYSGTSVAALDIDGDGWMDVVVGNRIIPQHYPAAAPSYVLRNTGDSLIDYTEQWAPQWSQIGIVNDLTAVDFNADRRTDIVAVVEWGPPVFFVNTGSGLQRTRFFDERMLYGWWWSVTPVDLNSDSYIDFILGNVGLNTKYKASREKPFLVYAGDVDSNATWDLVLAYYEGERCVPVRGRECSSQQMPFILEKFPTYEAFARAEVYDILGEDTTRLLHKEIREFRSMYMINQGGKGFEIHPLPWQAQLFPLMDVVQGDWNRDGKYDFILIGNEFNTEVETPRWDAGYGVVLSWEGSKGFEVWDVQNSGIYLFGNYKKCVTLNTQFGEVLLFVQNNGPLSIYAWHK